MAQQGSSERARAEARRGEVAQEFGIFEIRGAAVWAVDGVRRGF